MESKNIFMLAGMVSMVTPVVGVTFENRQLVIADIVNGDDLRLVAEPENKFDNEAVAVYSNDDRIGYVGKDCPFKKFVFDELSLGDGTFVAKAVNKRGGYSKKYSYGLDVEFNFMPEKGDEDDEEFVSEKRGSHRTRAERRKNTVYAKKRKEEIKNIKALRQRKMSIECMMHPYSYHGDLV